jgi:hypothetical protein
MLEVQEKFLWRDGFCLGIFECGAEFIQLEDLAISIGLLDNPQSRSF